MAYVPNSGSVVAFQSDPSQFQASITGTVTVRNQPSVLLGSGNASIITVNQGSVAAVIVGGSIAASFTPPANQSVSGTVNIGTGGPVSVLGTMSVLGTVPVTQVTNPWIITGSVQASITPAANQSVSGTVTVGSLLAMPGIVSTANSTTATLTGGAVFTGTSEEVKDFGSIVINVFSDQASATDGLSMQQSSNATNWDITDTYTVAASTGKTFQVQPAARFFRIVYTNGATPQGSFRLQTVFHPQMVKPTSQRAQDGYSNETDLEQQQAFGMVYNGSTWDRQRGTTAGTFVIGSVQAAIAGSVVAFQGGTRNTSVSGQVTVVSSIAGGIFPIAGSVAAVVTNVVNIAGSVAAFQAGVRNTSIIGSYAEDSIHTDGNVGIFNLGVRNDAVASFVGANIDYTPLAVDSAGRTLNKAFAPDQASVIGHNSIVAVGTAAGSVVVMMAPGAGLKNYLTDFNISNTGVTTTIVQFNDSDASLVGRTIAPAGGGSNHSFAIPLTTMSVNKAIAVQLITASSVWITVTGYKAP